MILVLSPLKLENQALTDALGPPTASRSEGYLQIKLFDGGHLATAIGGHGKVQFALSTQFLIQRLQPELVICAGSCGALSPMIHPLDLIAASNTIEHDFNLKFIKRPLPRFAGHSPSLNRLQGMHNLHIGDIASGDEDVLDSTRAMALHQSTGAIAVGWEGAGGARACAFMKVPFLELRAATDNCNGSARSDFQKNVRAGMVRIKEALDRLKGP